MLTIMEPYVMEAVGWRATKVIIDDGLIFQAISKTLTDVI